MYTQTGDGGLKDLGTGTGNGTGIRIGTEGTAFVHPARSRPRPVSSAAAPRF